MIRENLPNSPEYHKTFKIDVTKNLGQVAVLSPASPERAEISDIAYPYEYFDAQVQFAKRWSVVADDSFSAMLLRKTSLYRTISGQIPGPEGVSKNWTTLTNGVDDNDPSMIASRLYDAFLRQPRSRYTAPDHDGAFGYDYYPNDHLVKIHFTNPRRGESPFSADNMPQRQNEFKHLLEHIQDVHPDADKVVSASWIRSTKSYQSLFPPDLNTPKSLMSTDMFLGGDSVWGQFMDRNGNINQRVYDQFITAIQDAKSPEDLIAAFPYKVLRVEDSIEKYYRYYNVEPERISA